MLRPACQLKKGRNVSRTPDASFPVDSVALAGDSLPVAPAATCRDMVHASLWRGARFGFSVYLLIMLPVLVIGVFIRFFEGSPSQGIAAAIVETVGSLLMVLLGFGVFIGAVPGALISAVAAFIRWKRSVQKTTQ